MDFLLASTPSVYLGPTVPPPSAPRCEQEEKPGQNCHLCLATVGMCSPFVKVLCSHQNDIANVGRTYSTVWEARIGQYVFTYSRLALTCYQAMRECYKSDLTIQFLWPKMHSLTHLTSSIRGKGVVGNSSTDCGEGLHPQLKKDYRRSNRQNTAEDQVCSMLSPI